MRGSASTKPKTILVAALLALGTLNVPACAQAAGFKVVYSFRGGRDGAQPGVSLRGRTGKLYGATGDGGGRGCGGSGCGTVFELNPDGTKSVLHRFARGADGYYPGGVVADRQGDFYGTTYYGGNKKCNGNGCGTVYRLASDGTETVLHVFSGGRDGALPTSLIDVKGELYGTTQQGGIRHCGPYDCGTVFRVTRSGTESVVHRFSGGDDGAFPSSSLVADSAGNLYGTTEVGGSDGCQGGGCGTAFKIAPDGSETILHAFVGGTDGSAPTSSLVLDKSGNLYGTTALGGSTNCMGYGCGTVFKISSDGTEQVLYAFQGTSDGNWPSGNVIIDASGNLYGTAELGGEGEGVVFEVAPDGIENVLHAFTGGDDGAQPNGLIADGKGTLFGSTTYGGMGSQGVVFKLQE